MTDQDIIASLSPVQVVGLTLWGEARGESRHLRHAIGSAVLNRVKAQRQTWGLTAQDVCLAPLQFSCWNAGADRNHQALLEAARHLLRQEPIGPILRESLELAARICDGTLPDAVKTSTHYYSPDAMVPRGRVPKWARGHSPAVIIDNTHFFAGIR